MINKTSLHRARKLLQKTAYMFAPRFPAGPMFGMPMPGFWMPRPPQQHAAPWIVPPSGAGHGAPFGGWSADPGSIFETSTQGRVTDYSIFDDDVRSYARVGSPILPGLTEEERSVLAGPLDELQRRFEAGKGLLEDLRARGASPSRLNQTRRSMELQAARVYQMADTYRKYQEQLNREQGPIRSSQLVAGLFGADMNDPAAVAAVGQDTALYHAHKLYGDDHRLLNLAKEAIFAMRAIAAPGGSIRPLPKHYQRLEAAKALLGENVLSEFSQMMGIDYEKQVRNAKPATSPKPPTSTGQQAAADGQTGEGSTALQQTIWPPPSSRLSTRSTGVYLNR